MTREEILKAALAATKDARQAMDLAREMAAFLGEGAATPQSVTAVKVEEVKIHTRPHGKAPNRAKKFWTAEERRQAAALLDEGASYAEVGRIMGRSRAAILKARIMGHLPVKRHTLNEMSRLSGAQAVFKRGQKLTPRVEAALNGRVSS